MQQTIHSGSAPDLSWSSGDQRFLEAAAAKLALDAVVARITR